ncbi:MAG TPA: FHA domain-containing protein [Gemmataceae bacterium]|nr:FHA domain-containing protein [Gemmataceae bacterium]
MKLSLIVLTQGKSEGKNIPVTMPQLLIGRDPQCNLRPASPLISKRHCAILIKGKQAFVRDFKSTNGTFVNDEQITAERELTNGDQLKVGPLLFRVLLETETPVDKPTPMPPTKASPTGGEEDDAAALLLSLQEGTETSGSSDTAIDSAAIASGSTIMEMLPTPEGESSKEGEKEKAEPDKSKPAKTLSADTSTAAKAILEKYIRRPRGG